MDKFNRIDDFVRGAANGATFGLADVLAGTMDTVIHGGSLTANIRKEMDRSEHAFVGDFLAYAPGLITGAYMTGQIVSHALSGQGMWDTYRAGLKVEALEDAGLPVPDKLEYLSWQGTKSAYTALGSGTSGMILPELEIFGGKGLTREHIVP